MRIRIGQGCALLVVVAAYLLVSCSALTSQGLDFKPDARQEHQHAPCQGLHRRPYSSEGLRLSGGAEDNKANISPYVDADGNFKDWDELSSLEMWDARLTKALGKYWKFFKNTIGLVIDPTDLPENTKHVAGAIADFKKLSEDERKKLKHFAGGNVRPFKLKDNWMWWYMKQGPVYWLNPLTYFMRYMRGTEKFVKSAVVYLQDPPDWAGLYSINEHLAVLEARYPEGFSLTKAQMVETLYRAGMDDYAESLFKAKNGTWCVKAAKQVQGANSEFADKEDTKMLKELKEMLAEKPGRNATAKPLFKAVTQKYKGAHKDAVHRLQRELMRIQVDNTYEVELVKDNIFHWWVTIEGANNSYYEGEKFKLQFVFDEKYPMEPPGVQFVTHVPGWRLPETDSISTGRSPSWRAGQEWMGSFGPQGPHHCPIHPHIYTNGHICLSIIYTDWKPTMGVESVCLSVVSMLSSAKEKRPPEDNLMHVDSAPQSAKNLKGWDFHDHEA